MPSKSRPTVFGSKYRYHFHSTPASAKMFCMPQQNIIPQQVSKYQAVGVLNGTLTGQVHRVGLTKLGSELPPNSLCNTSGRLSLIARRKHHYLCSSPSLLVTRSPLGL